METFVRAYFNVGKFRPKAKFVRWLYQIALNLCRDRPKSLSRSPEKPSLPILPPDESFDAPIGDNKDPGLLLATDRRPDESTDRREELAALENAINELPEDLKNVFILTALEKRQQGEVQELLGISPKAVETRLYRARKLLLDKMGKKGF